MPPTISPTAAARNRPHPMPPPPDDSKASKSDLAPGQPKWWAKSITILASLVGALQSLTMVARTFGIALPFDLGALLQALSGVLTAAQTGDLGSPELWRTLVLLVSSMVAIYGRARAKGPVTSKAAADLAAAHYG